MKASLNLAYKIVNYVFDSEISQTAGAKEYKPTQGVGRSRKNILRVRQMPSKRMLKLKLFWGNNSYSHIVCPLPQPKFTRVNQPPHLLFPSFSAQALNWESLLPHVESWAIMSVATREKEPGQNLKECVDRDCEKKSHRVEKFGLNFFQNT